MIRKVEEAIGVFDGVTAPYDGIDVEVSWIDGKSVVAFGGVSITLPPSLIVVEWADLAEANEILDRMQSLSGVTKMLKAIVSEAYPPDTSSRRISCARSGHTCRQCGASLRTSTNCVSRRS